MLRQDLFGISIHALKMEQAVDYLRRRVSESAYACRYVVTPNVDHTVLLQTHQGLREAYTQADLVLADGHPLVWASRMLGRPLPERVAGSDLVPSLFQAIPHGETLRIFLLGAAPGVADRAASNITRQWPNILTVGVDSPPLGFERNAAENARILAKIADARPDVLILGLGAPKQECWIHQHRSQVVAKTVLCVGATIDFLAGEKTRAPRWMQRSGLEWLHRMSTEPKRLVKRYAKDAWVFPQLVWRQWREQRAADRRPSY
jgi:N-acetylglucosaminyldiphosphoundecaprenol N-acetyl-beta-D-mannosaminyltransferase